MPITTNLILSRTLLAAVGTATLLAGCGGGAPSETDITRAVQRQMSAEREAIEKIAGKSGAGMFQRMVGELKSVRKIGCKEDGEKAYQCDVELEIAQGDKTAKGATVMRFVQTSDGWTVSK